MPRLLLTVIALAATLATPAAGAEPELMRAEKAFRYSAELAGDQLIVTWDVADGYYLYKKRFGFRSLDPQVTLGEPAWPEGEIHEDEFFGRSTIYRGRFELRMPVEGTPSGAEVEIEVKSQGCADIGVCLPPQTWTTRVAAAGTAAGGSGGTDLAALLSGGSSGPREFLPADEAFVLAARRVGPDRVALGWVIAPGYYLYRDQVRVVADGRPLELDLPPGETKYDEFFGDVQVYYQQLDIEFPAPAAGSLEVGYQGCAEDGICYPPVRRTLDLEEVPSSAGPAGPPMAEQDRLAGLIRDGHPVSMLAVFFGLGLLLAFTPCVLPMVPILSGIIIGQGPDVTTRKAFSLSLAFVLAMAVTYTLAGVVVALMGHNLQATFQHPAVLVGFAAVFVALALAMFGFYELQVPAALQTRLTEISNRQQSGTLAGAGVMGFLSALIVGPCVAAPLAAALIVIGQSGDPVRGGAALFSLSVGMGAPLLAFGASAGKLLPRAGPWMATVKNLFGVLLLAVAAWMLERIVPPAAGLALWGAVVLVGALFLGAMDPLPEGAGPGRRLGKAAGILVLLYGAALVLGAAGGGNSLTRPLAGLFAGGAGGGTVATGGPEFRIIKTVADLDREIAGASAAGRGVLLDFYADWCVDCKRMEKYTFPVPEVRQALGDTVLLKADVTANDADDRALMNRFGIFGPPATLFFGLDGKELGHLRLVGFVPPDEFAAHVARARAGGR
jgi:thiol:disulfide interchange protein DsbD